MATSTSLKTFVDWNDDAVDLMEQGRTDKAVTILRMSLRCLKTYFDSDSDFEHTDPDATGPMRKRSRLDAEAHSEGAPKEEMLHHANILYSVQIGKTKEDLDMLTSNSLFTFYPKAFKIDGSKPCLLEETKIMVVLIYNLTIVYHISAIKERQLGPGRFSHVLDMYRTALQFAASYWDHETAISMSWVVLAISNNIGFIHSNSDSFNFQETRDSLNQVATLLLTMATYHQRNKVLIQEYKVFLESIFIFLDGSGLFVAPAA